MRMVRAIALGVAMLIAMPYVAVEGEAAAQVWKPKSRQKKKPKVDGATTEAKSVSTKTRKPGKTKSVKRSPKKKQTVAKKKPAKKKKKKPVVADDDDEFFIVEEDYPDED